MTTSDLAPAPKAESEKTACCGQGGAWVPPEGSPLIPSCQLCPKSATYWRAKRDT